MIYIMDINGSYRELTHLTVLHILNRHKAHMLAYIWLVYNPNGLTIVVQKPHIIHIRCTYIVSMCCCITKEED